MNNVQAEEFHIGRGAIIEPTASIRGLSGKAKKVVIGDHVYIGHNVQIICDDFAVGDYSKIHHDTNVHGYKPCHIGHNAWIGQFTIIDSIGGTTIGNNCGIGAHSQLWSHIKYGDMLEGCRFLSESPLQVGNDVWFVGHCIVSPIVAEDKSMALVGSVVTRRMAFNEIYGGNPAASLSAKIGYQFVEVPLETKVAKMQEYLIQAGIDQDRVRVVADASEIKKDERTYFAVKQRTYTKLGQPEEIKFMKFLLPDKAKFTPIS